MNWHQLAAGALAALVVAASLRAADTQEITKVRSIEGITEYQLSNGLKVLLFPDESKPKVTVNLTLFVGSRQEGYGETGMAHLLEHMLFKGTPTHPQIPKELTQRGADFNGTTWLDRTNYYESLPASDENLEFAIRLEADRMINSNIKKEDLNSEMTVVRNEFERGENTPSLILSQRIMATAYEWHNYGKSTIGNRADIERVPIEKLKAFYKKYYQPDNAMLVVAGRFEVDKALELIKKYFAVLPRPERKLDETYTEEPVQDGERFVTLRRVGDVAAVGAVYHICAGADPEFASIEVMEDILTAAPAGRLYKALVEAKKASRINGFAFALHDPGVLEFEATVSQGNEPDAVLSTMLDVIEQVAEKGVTAEEVERGQRRLLKQRELESADSGEIAINLSEWAAQGDWRLYFLDRDRIEKVTPESVKAVAAKYLKQSNRTVGIFVPTENADRSTPPQTPDVAKMIGDYKGRESAATGEAFEVTPTNIEQRTQRLTLPSGIKVALLKKATRNQAVNLILTLRYGNEKNLRGMSTACDFLPDIMSRGTKKLTRQQLQDALDEQSAALQSSGDLGKATFAIETKRDNLPAVLELLRQVLREPTLPDSELEILKRSQVSALENSRKEPSAVAPREVRRKAYPYPPDDPRYSPTLDEEIASIKALDRAALAKLYEGFLNGENGELAIVGDFDEKTVMPIIEKSLADWKASEPYERIKYTLIADKGYQGEILTPGKANAMYFSLEGIPLNDSDPDFPALVIGDFIFGGGSLSSRLGDRIREQEGLSYGVRSGFQSRALDPRSAFYIYAIANPVNMPKVKSLIREELDKFLEKGVTDKELQTGIAGFLQSQRVDWTSDGSLAGVLSKTSEDDRTMQYYADLEAKIIALTPAQIGAAYRKHIDPKRMIIVTAGDFKAQSDAKPVEKSK